MGKHLPLRLVPLEATPGERDLAYWEGQDPAPPSYVYVISEEGVDDVAKIGVARDVRSRIASLQTGNPSPLCLRLLLVGDQELEWHLHQRFKDFRHLGEWFSGDLQAALAEVAELAEKMRECHEGNPGELPTFQTFTPWHFKRDKRRGAAMKVSFVTPEPADQPLRGPMTDEQKAKVARRYTEEWEWVKNQPPTPHLPI